MEIHKQDYQELLKLEESLWIPEIRFDQVYMDNLLTPDFFEFGRSGKIYNREQILSRRPQAINATFPLKNFKVELITSEVAQVTYVSEVMYDKLEIGNRSSIWLKTPTGWKLRFHQGTVVENSL
ncbi:DUF4440 domain-containing protein [Acetobacteraceae bacterium]|nr:DUF4440 domain-containing protein [Candidatus Parcubacteria bacterium]